MDELENKLEMSGIGKSIETKRKLAVARGWGGEWNGGVITVGFLFGVMEMFLYQIVGMVVKTKKY